MRCELSVTKFIFTQFVLLLFFFRCHNTNVYLAIIQVMWKQNRFLISKLLQLVTDKVLDCTRQQLHSQYADIDLQESVNMGYYGNTCSSKIYFYV